MSIFETNDWSQVTDYNLFHFGVGVEHDLMNFLARCTTPSHHGDKLLLSKLLHYRQVVRDEIGRRNEQLLPPQGNEIATTTNNKEQEFEIVNIEINA